MTTIGKGGETMIRDPLALQPGSNPGGEERHSRAGRSFIRRSQGDTLRYAFKIILTLLDKLCPRILDIPVRIYEEVSDFNLYENATQQSPEYVTDALPKSEKIVINRADLRLLKWMKEDVCNSVTHNVTVTRKNLMIREPVPSRSPQLARKGSQLGLICRHNYGVLPRENEKEALLYHSTKNCYFNKIEIHPIGGVKIVPKVPRFLDEKAGLTVSLVIRAQALLQGLAVTPITLWIIHVRRSSKFRRPTRPLLIAYRKLILPFFGVQWLPLPPRYCDTNRNVAIGTPLRAAVSDANDEVRHWSLTAHGFVMFK
ncbi:hypothetical protein Aperf_G00000054124 [Anoplocephala perfoliata]